MARARAALIPMIPLAERPHFDQRRLDEITHFSAATRWHLVYITVIMAVLLWLGGVPPIGAIAWLLASLAIREARFAALDRLIQQTDRPVALRLRQATLWSLAQGLSQGGAVLFLPQMDVANGAMLTMVLMCMSVGAACTMFTLRPAFIAYAGSISGLVLVMWALTGTWTGIGIAMLVLTFILVQLRFAHQNMELFTESYAMRLENMTLLHQLSEERRQLAQARDAAVQADVSKSRFLAAASHDLRQPLQSLTLNIGALTRLQRDEESRHIAEDIGIGIEALRQMLDALLDVSKLDAGAVRPALQPIPLDLLITGMCKRLRPAAQEKGLELVGECPPGLVVSSDVDMLQRVLANLIDNAIKFTASGRISLTADRAEPGRVLLTVQDSGIGIAPADQDRVFEDLVQLQNPQRDRSFGHGLGLGIVRRLTRLLDIECRLESEPGQGSRFLLNLPGGDSPAPHEADASPPYASLLKLRVLVLDDDSSVRTAYANALQGLGCQVCSTGTLAEAMEALVAQEPDILLTDFRLAESSNGLDAIRRLKAERPALIALLVSADTSAALREQAARLGVPILRKPVSETMLAAAINEALRPAPMSVES